jgi:hypothetical protein
VRVGKRVGLRAIHRGQHRVVAHRQRCEDGRGRGLLERDVVERGAVGAVVVGLRRQRGYRWCNRSFRQNASPEESGSED